MDECNGDESIEEELPGVPEEEQEQKEEPETAKTTVADTSFDIYDDIVEVTPPAAVDLASPIKVAAVAAATVEESPVKPVEKKEEEEARGTHFSILEPKNLNVCFSEFEFRIIII